MTKNWKKDGYFYQKRSNGRGFKEVSKLVGPNKGLKCLYSTIQKDDAVYDLCNLSTPDLGLRNILHKLDNSSSEYIQRRIYQDVSQGPAAQNSLRLVQYFIKPSELSKIKISQLAGQKKENHGRKMTLFSEVSKSNDISTYDE